MLSLKQAIFILVFSILFLLLLLLGESHLGWYVMGVTTFLFLFFSQELQWDKVQDHTGVLLIWLLFLISILVSLFNAFSIPLALSGMIFYFFSFIWFLFFLLIKRDFLPRFLIIQIVMLIGLVFCGLTLTFFLFPSLTTHLPGMNLFHARYGHNHFAAYLLLLIPLTWWIAIQYQKWFQYAEFIIIIPIFLTCVLCITFGRTAIIIGIFQLFTILFLFKKHIPYVKIIFIFSLFASLVIMSSIAFFALHPKLKNTCPFPQFEKQLCKPLESENRPLYFQQALHILKKHPLTGIGIGNYSIGSQMFYQTPHVFTRYAHNAFLHIFAEIGIFGGVVFAILMLTFMYESTKNVKKNTSPTLKKFLLIALISMYVNVLLDFDWSFLGILCSSLLFVTLLIRKEKRSNSLLTKKRNIYKPIYYINSFFLLAFTLVYLITEILIWQGKSQKAFSLFPYFSWQSSLYSKNSTLTEKQKRKLLAIYKHHVEVLQNLLNEDFLSKKEKQTLRKKILNLDPWKTKLAVEFVEILLDEKQYLEAEEYIQQFVTKTNDIQKKYNDQIFYKDSVAMAKLALQLADTYFHEQKYETSSSLYNQAQKLDAWILHDHSPPFKQNSVENKQWQFFHNLDFDFEYIGQYRETYAKHLQALTLNEMRSDNFDENQALEYVKKMIEIADWIKWESWITVSNESIERIYQALEKDNTLLAKKYADFAFKVLHIFETKNEEMNYEQKEDLAFLYMQIGKQSVGKHEYIVADCYARAYEILPWGVSTETHWIEDKKTTDIESHELLTFMEATKNWSDHQLGYKQHVYQETTRKYIKYLLENKRAREALALAAFIDENQWAYDWAKAIQQYDLYEQKDWEAIRTTLITENNQQHNLGILIDVLQILQDDSSSNTVYSYDLYQFLERLTPVFDQLSYDQKYQLAQIYVRIGNQNIGNGNYIVADCYNQARTLVPWILNDEQQWIENVEWDNVDPKEIVLFAKNVQGLQGDAIGWKQQAYIQLFQKAANIQMHNKNWQKAIQLLQTMQTIEPVDYAALLQLGNFYLLRGEWFVAKNAYRACSTKFESVYGEKHEECWNRYTALEKKEPIDQLRYWEVSEIIFENKDWEDFE